MRIRFLEIAQVELDDAIIYYNNEVPGLGDQFLIEITKGIALIHKYPESWHQFTEDTRRCLIRRFPYGIVYKIHKNEIVVIGIMHLHRIPDYLKNRFR